MNTINRQDDFVSIPVPQESRRSWIQVGVVWVGFIVVVGVMAIGGGLAGGMQANQIIPVVLLGNFILGLFAAFSGYVGAKSGMTFAQLCFIFFPGNSAKIVSMYAPISLICWFAIECAISGGVVAHAAGLSDLNQKFVMSGCAFLFAITNYFGFKAIRFASALLVPIVLTIGSYAMIVASKNSAAAFGFSKEIISFEAGLGLVIGSWAQGVFTSFPDLARFCKTPLIASILGFFGIFIFNSLQMFTGAAGAALTTQYDPALIILSIGIPLLAIVFSVANIWTTNDNNLYSASLGIARAFSIPRRASVLLCSFLGLILAFFNPAQFTIFFKFLLFLGSTAPALGGVVLGGFIIKERMRFSGFYARNAWAGWILGSIASYLLTGIWSALVGFFIGFLVWFMLSYIAQLVEAK